MAIPTTTALIEQAKQKLMESEFRERVFWYDHEFMRSIFFIQKMTLMENWALDEIDAMVRRAKAKHGLPHNPAAGDVFHWKR